MSRSPVSAVAKLKVGQIEVHFEAYGEGDPVVFLHEDAVSSKYKHAGHGWVKVLNDSSMPIIGLDVRGHGQRDKPVIADILAKRVTRGDRPSHRP